jgi:uncharacterized protein (TIGR04255 family)
MNAEATDRTLDAFVANYKRVIYDKNPLFEVILQVRFPTFLRLLSELPSDFQGKILADYPYYQMQEALEVKMPGGPNMPPSLLETKVHIFLSADKKWRIALGSDSISLATKEYREWNEFKARAEFCLQTFFVTYPIKVITRINLRYRNLIRRSEIGKEGTEWPALINPFILGPMGAKEFHSIALETARWSQRFAIRDIKINFQGGIARQKEEECYDLDCDVFLTKEIIAESKTIQSELEQLHKPIGPLFRWAITDELHAALVPPK